MANKITFRYADKFSYTGLGEVDKVEYVPSDFILDEVKLIDFLGKRGKQIFDYKDFESTAKQYHGSLLYDIVWGPKTVSRQFGIEDGDIRRVIPVSFKLNSRVGEIDLSRGYPVSLEINPRKYREIYTIKIPYADSEKPYEEAQIAITITCGDFYEAEYILSRIHHKFNNVEHYIYEKFNEAFDRYSSKDELDFLYEQAPIWVVSRRSNEKVFSDLKIILGGSVNSYGTNEEVAVLNIIRSFGTYPYHTAIQSESLVENFSLKENADFLLQKCIDERIEGVTVFQRIYELMNDYGGEDNFSKFIQLFHLFWIESKYPKVNYGKYTDTHPLILDYRSNKILGFYSDGNKSFNFNGTHIKIVRRDGTFSYGLTNRFEFSDTELGNPHIYQPISLPTIQQDGQFKFLSSVAPAFFLKAFDDKNVWTNIEKATWLTIDILTTISGVGNILKLRHLKKVVDGMRYLRIFIAGIEVSSGVAGLMINFVDACDNPDDDSFCNKLRTFLIYLDLATLGVDALASRFIKKAAQDALNAMPDIIIRENREIFDELRRIVRGNEISESTKTALNTALAKHDMSVRYLQRTIELYDGSNNFIFKCDPFEVELYLNLITLPKSRIKNRISDANTILRSSSARYNPNSETALKYNVPPSKSRNGVDFDGTKYMHSPNAKFRLKLSGARSKDFQICREMYSEMTGLSIRDIKRLEKTYVWHHLDDLDENLTCTMQLVEKTSHEAKHIGSVAQFERISNIKYK